MHVKNNNTCKGIEVVGTSEGDVVGITERPKLGESM